MAGGTRPLNSHWFCMCVFAGLERVTHIAQLRGARTRVQLLPVGPASAAAGAIAGASTAAATGTSSGVGVPASAPAAAAEVALAAAAVAAAAPAAAISSFTPAPSRRDYALELLVTQNEIVPNNRKVKVRARRSPLRSSDSSQFLSACSSSPLVFVCSKCDALTSREA